VLKVFLVVCSTFRHRYYVMGVDFFSVESGFATYWTYPVLVFRYLVRDLPYFWWYFSQYYPS
jgi:hypothetical protein